MKRASRNDVYCNAGEEGRAAFLSGQKARANPYARPSGRILQALTRNVHSRYTDQVASILDMSFLGWRDGWRRAWYHDRWIRRARRRMGDYTAWPPAHGP